MGGVKAQLGDLADRSDLPMEAYAGSYECVDIDDSWLSQADERQQSAAMKVWFEERYFDPARESRESDGDAYEGGGPFSPAPQIRQRFSAWVAKEVIEGLIDELLFVGGERWAPRRIRPPEIYNEYFSIYVAARTAPLQKTMERIGEIRELLNLPGHASSVELVRNLAFGAAITALESFLWETMVFWVENEEGVVRNIITTHPAFKDQPIKLGTIFEKSTQLKKDILGFMQGVVWHNWEKVGTLYKYGLGIKKLNLDHFSSAVFKRHDIVHRSGFTKDGEKVSVSLDEIIILCQQISRFAVDVAKQIESVYDDDLPF